jgi:Ca-activated chloride channel homolog
MYELDEPKYFYLLAIIPLMVGVYVLNLYWRRRKQREFGDVVLLRKLTPGKSSVKPMLKFSLFLGGLAFLILGLVNPKIGTKTETVKREGIDIVFAMDVSKSMLSEDVAPNRLDKSKQIVSQIISQLAGDRIGIIAYAASAFPVLPVTSDYAVSRMFLQSMNTDMLSSQGTSLKEAIELAGNFFEQSKDTNKLLVLVSDGEDHEEGAEEAAREAKKAGIKIITIGIGTTKGGPIPVKENGRNIGLKRDSQDQVVITRLDPVGLKQIALATGGGYVYGGNTREAVDFVKNALDNIDKTEFESQQYSDYNAQFQWFLAMALLLFFLDLFIPERKSGWIRKLNLFNEKQR